MFNDSKLTREHLQSFEEGFTEIQFPTSTSWQLQESSNWKGIFMITKSRLMQKMNKGNSLMTPLTILFCSKEGSWSPVPPLFRYEKAFLGIGQREWEQQSADEDWAKWK